MVKTVTASVLAAAGDTWKPFVTASPTQAAVLPLTAQPAALALAVSVMLEAPPSMKLKFPPPPNIVRMPEAPAPVVYVSEPPVTSSVATCACKPPAASATTAAIRQTAESARRRARETPSGRAGVPAAYCERSESGAGARRPRVNHEIRRAIQAIRGLIVDRLYTNLRL